MMRRLFALLSAGVASAQIGTVWLRDVGSGFCDITNASNTSPIVITVANMAACGLANGNKVLVNGVRGNLAAISHLKNAADTENVIYTVAGLSGNTFNLMTNSGLPTNGAVDGSCGGSPLSYAGTCAYSGGGRVGKASQYTLPATGPLGFFDGTGGARTNAYLGASKNNSTNPPFDPLITDATAYETNYGSVWGYEQLTSNGLGGGAGSGGGYGKMTITSALKWFLTGNAASRTLVMWAMDNIDQLLGTTACDPSSSVCGISQSGMMDYAKEGAQASLYAYSIIESELSPAQKERVASYLLNDEPWQRGGIHYTASNFTRTVFTKLASTAGGTISASLGVNQVVTGVGTTFTTQCAVGGMIIENYAYGLPFKITAITDNTHLTVSVSSRTFSGAGFACGPAWTNTQIGWRGFMSTYEFATLNGSQELNPYNAPPDNGHLASPFNGNGANSGI